MIDEHASAFASRSEVRAKIDAWLEAPKNVDGLDLDEWETGTEAQAEMAQTMARIGAKP